MKEFDKLLKKLEVYHQKNKNCIDQSLKINLLKAYYFKQENNLDSLSKYAFLSFKKAQNIQSNPFLLESIELLVHLYTRLNENDKIWKNLKLYQSILTKMPTDEVASHQYNWLGFQYEYLHTKDNKITLLDSAAFFGQKALIIAKKQQNFKQMAYSYRLFESNSYHRGNYKNAIIYVDSALYYAKRSIPKINLGSIYLSKAWNYVDLKENAKAEICLDSALLIHNKEFKNTATNMMMYFEASTIYEQLQKPKKALENFKKYSHLKDSIVDVKKVELINDLEIKYKSELKDVKIQNLEQKEQINQLQIETKNATIYKLTFALIFTLIIIIIIVYIIKIKELKKLKKVNSELQIALQKQQDLEQKLIQTRDNIAQDFHDDLGNVLARISLQTKMLLHSYSFENENINTNIKQINSDVNTLYQETRDFIFSLKTTSDDIFEFVNYLIDFGEDLFKNSNINFNVEKEIDNPIKLPDYWSRQLILIYKEAFTNTLKHSNATNAKLTILQKSSILKIAFTDDGKGFNQSEIAFKNGLANMKRRALKIGVDLEITSTKKGTSIIIQGKI
ncbi:sensor histidine kinase [Polaribacter sp.]|uniref:sensor histidine kinase n=1 Tax=Polaribacter sp. TaxID=1920175 RepID=UPI004047C640